MEEQNSRFILADNSVLVVKEPITAEETENLFLFFSKLPQELQNRLRYDVTDRTLFTRRLKQVDRTDHWRLIAELDGTIIADGAMDREPYNWTRHVADLRAVVDPAFADLNIECVLFRQFVDIGRAAGVERFFTELLSEQKKLIEQMQSTGFVYEATRKNYVKDRKGKLHDVVILSNDSSTLWTKLVEHIDDLDIQLPRIHKGE